MKKQLNQVEEFGTTALLGSSPDVPQLLSKEEGELRYKLGKEELDEYLEAQEKGDLIEVADALGDQLYILCGTILRHGLRHKIIEVFNAIHDSNMSKFEDGKPIKRWDGKVIKGKYYFKPNIRKVLNG